MKNENVKTTIYKRMNKYGFSLIEILIVIMLIGILAILARPHYKQYMVRANRLEARTALLQLATRLERYHFSYATYRNANLADFNLPEYTASHGYRISIQSANETNYLISASPIGVQADRDINCGTLLIDASNRKFVTGRAKVTDCWG